LRSVDILGLRLSDIDWANDTLCVRQSKTGRSLKIPLSADVGNSLSSYILTERPNADTPVVFLRFQAPHKPLSDHSASVCVCVWLCRCPQSLRPRGNSRGGRAERDPHPPSHGRLTDALPRRASDDHLDGTRTCRQALDRCVPGNRRAAHEGMRPPSRSDPHELRRPKMNDSYLSVFGFLVPTSRGSSP